MVKLRPPWTAVLVVLIVAMCARLAAAVGSLSESCFEILTAMNKLRSSRGLQPLVWASDPSGLGWKAAKLAESASGLVDIATCPKRLKTGDPDVPGAIVWSCDKMNFITGKSKSDCSEYTGIGPYDEPDPSKPVKNACADAASLWTSYTWKYSSTPLDDNKQGLEYAQIMWPTATSVACVQSTGQLYDTATCVYVVCMFDKPAELTNAALLANIKEKAPSQPADSQGPSADPQGPPADPQASPADQQKCPDVIPALNKMRKYRGLTPLEHDKDLENKALKLAESGSGTQDGNPDTCNVNCRSRFKTGDSALPPGAIVWSCAVTDFMDKKSTDDCSKYTPTLPSDDKSTPRADACADAANLWTSYNWIYTATPLEHNKQVLEYAQIMWPTVTKAGCAKSAVLCSRQASCVYVVCMFDAPAEFTNAALVANIK